MLFRSRARRRVGRGAGEAAIERDSDAAAAEADGFEPAGGDPDGADFSDAGPVEADWARETLETGATAMEQSLDTGVENAFDVDRTEQAAEMSAFPTSSEGLSATSWSGPGGDADGEDPNLEAYVAARLNLRDHLTAQLSLACPDARDRLIGQAIIDAIDDAGYLRTPTAEIADRLGASTSRVDSILRTIQTFEPTGVGARDLEIGRAHV